MSRRRTARRTLLAAAASAALTAFGGARANADGLIDLRAVALNGQPIAGGNTTKNVYVSSAGEQVTVDVFARISGTNGVNDEGFTSIHGSFISSGSLLGSLAGGPVAPFRDSGFQDGSVQDLDGDTDLDVGVTPNGGTPTTGYFIARASALQTNGTVLDANTEEFRIGQLTFTVGGSSGDTFLNFYIRANASGGNVTTASLWSEDGSPAKALTHPYSTGAPVRIVVPEPGSAAAAAGAALAGVGLHARRRISKEVT
jgi:hypothetical protein